MMFNKKDPNKNALISQGRSGIGRYTEEDKNKFPFEAFSCTTDTADPRTLTLTAAWKMVIKDDLNIEGSLDVDTNLNVDGDVQIDGDSQIDGNLTCDGNIVGDTIKAKPLIFHASHTVSNGTGGGTTVVGTRVTRTINTVITNTIPGASLDTNQITLPAGTYEVSCESCFYYTGSSISILRNTSDSSDVVISIPVLSASGNESSITSFKKRFVIAAEKVFVVEYVAGRAQTTTGLGYPASQGLTETYLNIWFEKVV